MERYLLELLDEADKEYKEAAQWYEIQRIGLGEIFIESVRKKLLFIQQYPERYSKQKTNFRETPVELFPYTIVYIFYKLKKTIIVTAIYHTSRDPKKKYRK